MTFAGGGGGGGGGKGIFKMAASGNLYYDRMMQYYLQVT